MATYQFVCRNHSGRTEKGVISADSRRAAREQLRKQGLVVRKLDELVVKNHSSTIEYLRLRRSRAEVTEFLRELATLMSAGVPLLQAIDSALPLDRSPLHGVLTSVRDEVSSGTGLADSMRKAPIVFDGMVIGMVQVGENAGNLDDILEQLVAFRERSSQLQNRVLTAITYPAIVLAVSVLVTLFLMTVVVPTLLRNLTDLGQTLPWPTRVLQFASNFILLHGWWGSIVVALGLAGAGVWARSEKGGYLVNRFQLKLPLFGSLIKKQAIGRAAMMISCLLKSGIELVEALRIVAKASNNLVLKKAIENVADQIERGSDIAQAISSQEIFPRSVAQVFSIGQQSGKLDSMLEKLGANYDSQADLMANRIAAVAEPLLILVLSIVVGFILFGTLLPILEAGSIVNE